MHWQFWLDFDNRHHVLRTTYILPTKTYLSSFPKPTTSSSAGTVFWTAGSKRSFHESIHNSNPYQLQTPLISQGNTSFLLSVIDSTAKLEPLAVMIGGVGVLWSHSLTTSDDGGWCAGKFGWVSIVATAYQTTYISSTKPCLSGLPKPQYLRQLVVMTNPNRFQI